MGFLWIVLYVNKNPNPTPNMNDCCDETTHSMSVLLQQISVMMNGSLVQLSTEEAVLFVQYLHENFPKKVQTQEVQSKCQVQ